MQKRRGSVGRGRGEGGRRGHEKNSTVSWPRTTPFPPEGEHCTCTHRLLTVEVTAKGSFAEAAEGLQGKVCLLQNRLFLSTPRFSLVLAEPAGSPLSLTGEAWRTFLITSNFPGSCLPSQASSCVSPEAPQTSAPCHHQGSPHKMSKSHHFCPQPWPVTSITLNTTWGRWLHRLGFQPSPVTPSPPPTSPPGV